MSTWLRLYAALPPLNIQEGEHPPLLEGPLALLTPHFNDISGIVLDICPGTGRLNYPHGQIAAVYRAEPNKGLHGAIR